jgi:hypothetical protein
MFRNKKKIAPPDTPFAHGDDCKIVKADPSVEIPWSEVETDHWRAVCVCGSQDHYVPAGRAERLDPLDPKTSQHAPQCEFAAETDPSVLRVLLKVRDGAGGGYWWVECGACETGWQVPHYSESVA